MLILTLLISNLAFAESAPICPSGHAMYYLGAKNFGTTPEDKLALSWSGNTSNYSTTYTFENNTTIKLSFSDINYLREGYPEASSFAGVTTNAINMRHSSQQIAINHRLTALINKPVSKYGFVIQDLDSNANGRYTESMSIDTAGGSFSNYNTNFTLTNLNKTITGNQWPNCNPSSPCNFNIEWGAQSANIPFVATHGNPYSGASSTTSTGDHLVGYSDFYFCLAPPKLIVKKTLSSTRVNNSDQFEIAVSGGSVAANSFTTTGTGSTITNGTSATLTLADSTNYTITERVMNGTTLGEIANYNATYTCSNATTGSTTVMPTSTMSYNASTKTRSFTLSDATYGDDITCTITNSPNYIFSGIVFNDNGGITDTQASAANSTINSGPYDNANYFNAIFNSISEAGISGSTIKLVDKCENPTITYATRELTSTSPNNIGVYQFYIERSKISGQNSVCIIETNSTSYSVRTTIDKRTINLVANSYDYPNNNFGRVIAKNVGLVLEKEQAPNNCKFSDFGSLTYSKNPLTSSDTGTGTDIRPGLCIAYKITATNRANVDINNFIMKDVLQKKSVNGATITSILALPKRATGEFSDNLDTGQNGTVITNPFTLAKRTKRSFYLNTQYGTTQSNYP